jgi:thymidylate synthase (FAD)
MKIVEPSFKFIIPGYDIYRKAIFNDFITTNNEQENSILQAYFTEQAKILEIAGRTAYKSENLITDESYKGFIKGMNNRGHGAVIEFGDLVVSFITDRGIAMECLRHRLCSFLNESTRYCNYSKNKFGKELTVVRPNDIEPDTEAYKIWVKANENAEKSYFELLDTGATPQMARSVLPLDLRSELVIKANFREWQHIFKLRVLGITGAPHPDIRRLLLPVYNKMKTYCPEVFDLDSYIKIKIKEETK